MSDVPAGSRYLDVDGIPVVLLPSGRCVAFSELTFESRTYPNEQKAGMEGDRLSSAEFAEWLRTGINRFDVSFHASKTRLPPPESDDGPKDLG